MRGGAEKELVLFSSARWRARGAPNLYPSWKVLYFAINCSFFSYLELESVPQLPGTDLHHHYQRGKFSNKEKKNTKKHSKSKQTTAAKLT